MTIYSDIVFGLLAFLTAATMVQQDIITMSLALVALAQTLALFVILRFSMPGFIAWILAMLGNLVIPLLPAHAAFGPHFVWQYPLFLVGMGLALTPVPPTEGKKRSIFGSVLLGASGFWQPVLIPAVLALITVMIVTRQMRGMGALPGFIMGLLLAAIPALMGFYPWPVIDPTPVQFAIHAFSPNRGLLFHAVWIIPLLSITLRKRQAGSDTAIPGQDAFLLCFILFLFCTWIGLATPWTDRVLGSPFLLAPALLALIAFGVSLPLIRRKKRTLILILPLMTVSIMINLATSLRPEARDWLDQPAIENWPERFWSFADLQMMAPAALATPGRFERQYQALLHRSSVLDSWRDAAVDNAKRLDLEARASWDQGDWQALDAHLSQLATTTVYPAANAMLPDLLLIAPIADITLYIGARRDALLALTARQDPRCYDWATGKFFTVTGLLPNTEKDRLFAAERQLFQHEAAKSLVPLHTGRPFADQKPPLTPDNIALRMEDNFVHRMAFTRMWLQARKDNPKRRLLQPKNKRQDINNRLAWCLQYALILDQALSQDEEAMRNALSYMFRQNLVNPPQNNPKK